MKYRMPISWRQEARATAALSGPLVLTNLGQIALHTTDVVMIGWLGSEALAASVLGANVFFMMMIFGFGLVLATAPMVAQDLGRKPYAVREPRRTVRQGFWVALAYGIPACVVLWHIAPILQFLQQRPELIGGAEDYVRAALWSLVPMLWFVVLRNFISALERPRAALGITLAAIGFNAAADYGLIFGNFGLPRLELTGAGLATAATNIFMLLGLIAFIQIDRRFRRYRLFGRFWRADWARFREILRIGLPIAVTRSLEVGIFVAAAFLMGIIGTSTLAAHQIALQCAAVTFMVPMGLGQAATVRVGLAVGRGDAAGAGRAGFVALWMGAVFMAAMAVILWTFPRTIVGLFLDPADPFADEVLGIAVTFLGIAAIFQIFDGAQIIGAGALQGLKDTRWPMVFAGIGYWVVGLGTGVGFGFGLGLGGVGIWIGLAAGLAAAAVLLVARFHLLQRSFAAAHAPDTPTSWRESVAAPS